MLQHFCYGAYQPWKLIFDILALGLNAPGYRFGFTIIHENCNHYHKKTKKLEYKEQRYRQQPHCYGFYRRI